MIIDTMATISAEAYQRGKLDKKYVLADREFVEPLIRDL